MQQIKSLMDSKKTQINKGIDNADTNKNFQTILFVQNFFCPYNNFVWTKGHLPPSRILPICLHVMIMVIYIIM